MNLKLFTKARLPIAIVILGFVLRVCYALKVSIFLDDSYFAYQASLILKGAFPFINFYSDPPLPLYTIAFFTEILGRSVLSVRFTSVTFDTLSIYMVYLISKDFLGSRAGIFASAIYAFTPFVLWYGVTPNEITMASSLMLVAFYIFERSLQRDYLLFLNGLVIGVAWFASRSVALLGPVEFFSLVILVVRKEIGLRDLFRKTVVIAMGFALALLPFYLFLLTKFTPAQVNLLYGFSGISLPSPFPAVNMVWKYKIISQALFQGIGLFPPAVMFASFIVTKGRVGRWFYLVLSTFVLGFIMLVAASYPPYNLYEILTAFERSFYYLALVGLALLVSGSLNLGMLSYVGTEKVRNTRSDPVILLLLSLGIIVFYFFYWNVFWAVSYSFYFSGIASVLVGSWISHIFHPVRNDSTRYLKKNVRVIWRVTGIALSIILIIGAIMSGILYASTFSENRPYPTNLVSAVSSYLGAHTNKNSFILGEQIFAYLSGTSDVINTSTLIFAYTRGSEAIGFPKGLIPTDKQVVSLMENHNVTYVVLDNYRFGSILQNYLPITNIFVQTYYSPVATYSADYSRIQLAGSPEPTITILSRPGSWNLADHLGSQPFVQAGVLDEPTGQPLINYNFSSRSNAFVWLLYDYSQVYQSVYSVGGNTKSGQINISPPWNTSYSSYLQFVMPANQYQRIVTSYGMPDVSENTSNGVKYEIFVSTDAANWKMVFSTDVRYTQWNNSVVDIEPYLGKTLFVRIVMTPYQPEVWPFPQITFELESGQS